MDRDEWRTCADPDQMLFFLEPRLSPRKLRLFAVACCRRIWPKVTKPADRTAVAVAEWFADGMVSTADLDAARSGAARLRGDEASTAAWYSVWADAYAAARSSAWYAASAAVGRRAARAVWDAERAQQAGLLREIVGDPFEPPFRYPPWPKPIVQLAEAIYNDQPVPGVLHVALREAGHANLAAHFSTGTWHPRGCWVVDLILGKG